MINYYIGDVIKAFLDIKEPVILIHGCNCFNTMGAGIAKQIKEQFPEVYEADCKTISGDRNKLGTYTYYQFDNKIVINAYTQYNYSSHKPQLDYFALGTVLEQIKQDFPNYKIIMPKIGAGLAGGNWDIISSIIEQIFPNSIIDVYSLS